MGLFPLLASADTASAKETRTFDEKIDDLPKQTKRVLADSGYDSNNISPKKSNTTKKVGAVAETVFVDSCSPSIFSLNVCVSLALAAATEPNKGKTVVSFVEETTTSKLYP